MIAASDALLVLVSAAALGAGLYRWQDNLEKASPGYVPPAVSVQTQPASTPQALDSGAITDASATPVALPTASTPTTNTAAGTAPGTTVALETPQSASVNVEENITTTAGSAGTTYTGALGRYVVQPGDTLSVIALKFDTTVRLLQNINELDDTVIYLGQDLFYPVPDN